MSHSYTVKEIRDMFPFTTANRTDAEVEAWGKANTSVPPMNWRNGQVPAMGTWITGVDPAYAGWKDQSGNGRHAGAAPSRAYDSIKIRDAIEAMVPAWQYRITVRDAGSDDAVCIRLETPSTSHIHQAYLTGRTVAAMLAQPDSTTIIAMAAIDELKKAGAKV